MALSNRPQRARRRSGSFTFLAAGFLGARAGLPGLAGAGVAALGADSARAAWSASTRSCRRFRTRFAITPPAFTRGRPPRGGPANGAGVIDAARDRPGPGRGRETNYRYHLCDLF